MTGLPRIIRRLPFVLYGAAVLFFAWGLANAWIGMAMATGPYFDESMSGLVNLQKSNALYQAALEALYLGIYGAMFQLLLGIYDRMNSDAGAVE